MLYPTFSTHKIACQEQGLVYLLGLLNSKLLRWYFPNIREPFRGGWLSVNRQFISQLPIRTTTSTIPTMSPGTTKWSALSIRCWR